MNEDVEKIVNNNHDEIDHLLKEEEPASTEALLERQLARFHNEMLKTHGPDITMLDRFNYLLKQQAYLMIDQQRVSMLVQDLFSLLLKKEMIEECKTEDAAKTENVGEVPTYDNHSEGRG